MQFVKKYFEKLDAPALPQELCLAIINYTEECIKNNAPLLRWYKRYETENKNSLAYVVPGQEYVESNNVETGGVGVYVLSTDLRLKIIDFYKDTDTVLKNYDLFLVQIVTGSNFVAPHVDPAVDRKEGLLYLLKAGGTNVRTRFYEVKPEFKNLHMDEVTAIPYSKLDMVEDYKLEENNWHYFNFSEIHSVENQESLRISLWASNKVT